MPSETNNTTDEFSPVLRRYLREREIVDCHGLDIDLATAYLERSLTMPVSSEYERHLADCPPCRLHLLELSRLAVLTAAPEPHVEALPPTVIPPGVPGRTWIDALREALAAPFRVPAFGVVGLALVVAFVTAGLVWQNRTIVNQVGQVGQVGKLGPIGPTGSTGQAGQSGEASGGPAGEIVASSEAQPGTLPSPQAVAQVDRRAAGTESGPGAGSVTDSARKRERNVESAPSDGARPAANGGGSTLANVSDGEPSRRILNLPVASEMTRQIPTLSRPEPIKGPGAGLQLSVKSGQRNAARGLDSTRTFQIPNFGEINGFASTRQPRAFADPAEGELATSVRIIRGKTFKLEGRTWVDQDYHQLMRSSGNVTLVFGDQAYERLVAETPLLADFFSLRSVTVVWNGKVYRVLAK